MRGAICTWQRRLPAILELLQGLLLTLAKQDNLSFSSSQFVSSVSGRCAGLHGFCRSNTCVTGYWFKGKEEGEKNVVEEPYFDLKWQPQLMLGVCFTVS